MKKTILWVMMFSVLAVVDVSASPTKTASVFWGTDIDNVDSKTGMSGIDLKNAFLYGLWSPTYLRAGVAAHFGSVWLGASYEGNFLNFQETDSSTNSSTDNGVKFTVHVPDLVQDMPMGFQVGFRISGTSADQEASVVNGQTYTPMLSYAIAIPLPVAQLKLSPALTVEVPITPNTSWTSSGNKTTDKSQMKVVPKATLDLDLALGAFGKSQLSTGLEYVASYAWSANETQIVGTVADDGSVGEIKTETQAEYTLGNAATLRYRQLVQVSDNLKLGWQAKVGVAVDKRFLPAIAVRDGSSITWTGQNYSAVSVDSDYNYTRYGAPDNWVYRSDLLTIKATPQIDVGLQYAMLSDKVHFNLKANIMPLVYTWEKVKIRATEQLVASGDSSTTGTAATGSSPQFEDDIVYTTVTTFSGTLGFGFSVRFAQNVLLDTSLSVTAGSNDPYSAFNLLEGSEAGIALSVAF